ncbi:Rexo1 protein [Amylocystis lapponica]|nr:Rexo1 protein [Amylocystis lapponica]
MFATLGLFSSLACPQKQSCTRPNCIFSHRPGTAEVFSLHIPVHVPEDSPVAGPSSSSIPAKRPIHSTDRPPATSHHASSGAEPPAKLRRTGPTTRPSAISTASHTSTGVPLLRVTAAQSQVAVPVRQAMLKNLYEHFCVLYEKILITNPTLASEHALRQEEEVYHKSNKLTYRHAVISSIASLKKRDFPDSISHPSVGTDADVAARAEAQKKMDALRLTAVHIENHVLSVDEMERWGYIVDTPAGEGGSRPSEAGSIKTCERCGQPFKVKRREEADECVFHWGRPFTSKADGERRRVYNCCSRSFGEEGCARGPHVFYDSSPEDLHLRHAFSFTRPASLPDSSGEGPSIATDTALDIVAMDCEMIYTTGGMRVARVSVVDSTGKEVFDELVRMDDGVEVIDYNTRFSGITPEAHASALLPLAAIRASLDALINSRTIIIGHGLENDLKTLRMLHHRCVDTAIMFPHPSGPPYRRALRALAKDFLGKTIQTGGGTTGHSSVEDSVATLDLVRWHVLNRPQPKPKPAESVSSPQMVDVLSI